MSQMQRNMNRQFGYLFFLIVLMMICTLVAFFVRGMGVALGGIEVILGFFSAILLLIYMLSIFSYGFGGEKITVTDHAFGLPKGTIRAVLALGALVIFVGMAVFLLESLSPERFVSNTKPEMLAGGYLSYQDENDLWHTILGEGDAETRNTLVTQIFTAISTLLASIAAFYFGARVAQHDKTKDPAGTTSPEEVPIPDLSELKKKADQLVKDADALNNPPPTASATATPQDIILYNQAKTAVTKLLSDAKASQLAIVTAMDQIKTLQGPLATAAEAEKATLIKKIKTIDDAVNASYTTNEQTLSQIRLQIAALPK